MRWPLPLKRIPRPRLTLTLAALFTVYLLLGFFALPRYLQRAIPEQIAQHLKREAVVGEVHVNPLLLSVELRDFALKDTDQRTMVGLRRLLVDFELSSLLRWAWTFSAIELDGLELNADIAPDGRFNFAALVADLPKSEGPPPPAAKPPRLLLQYFALADSAVTFSDRTGPKPAIATLRPLAIELRDLTTLPDRRGPYTISARLPGGATLAWRGEMSLQPIFSLGEVSLRDARPAAVWRFFENRLRIAEPAGSVQLELRYRATYTDGTPELTVEDIRVGAADLALSERGAREPFFALKAASATGGHFDLARRELHIPSIELRGAQIRAQTDADGSLNLQKLVVAGAPAPASPPPATGTPAKPWRVKLDAVGLREIELQYRDFSRALPMGLRVGALDVGLAAAAEVGAGDPLVSVNRIAVTLSRIALGEALSDDPLLRIDSVTLDGGSLDLGRQSIAARRLAIKGGEVKVTREADGRVRLLEVAKAGAGAPPRPEAKPGRPWRLALDAFDLDGVKVAVADRSFEQPLAYDIEPSIALRNVRNEGKAPIRLDAALKVAQGGSLRLSGEAMPAGDRASGRMTLERLNLAPLQPAVASRTTLALASGEVSAAFQAQYRVLKGRAELRGTGSASVDNLLISESVSGERFLEWKSVAASGIALDLEPDRLAIGEIAVRGLGAKVFVNKDRSTNLAQALKPAPKSTAPAPAPAADAQAAFPVSIERVHVDKAAVDFTDLSLVLPFAAKIQELGGDVLGLSTDRESRAVAKLEGRVDEFGLARIDGSLATYDPRAFLDLRVEFRNVEMTPLSAYSATFAGRRIASGRLGVDLRYKIDKGALAGDNAVEMRDFTLGAPVDAPGALSLPLDLAVALLTDKDGRIALAVPVKGDVNSPEFSYGHLIWQALSTVITNIVTAPFRALFGGGSENLESVAFDPGRAALLPPEREKLKRVAEALGQRPQLGLVVEGQHSDADRDALRRRDVAAAVAARLERSRPGEEPPPVNAREAVTQRVLEALFVQRNSEQALAAFVAETEKARGKPVARDGAFYDALLARLNETAPLPDDARLKLAAARAGAVTEHLEKALSVAATRLATKPSAAGDGERAALSLIPAPAKP